MNNAGSGLLKRSLDSLVNQTYKDFEVVISDNSENDSIEQMCGDPIYSSLRINYFKNPRKGMAQNTNEAIKQAKGEIIKILYQDDFLAHENSLKEIVDNFTGHWLVTGCEHENENGERYNPHLPTYSNKIKSGENSIGSPSVLSIKNGVAILFDENMTWMLDCD
jgi:glycosyltransferase involved in cell wall biosynthesis